MSFLFWSYLFKLINSIFFQQPWFPLHYILYIRGGWPGPHGRTSKSWEHFQNAQYCAWSPYMKYTLTHFPVEYFEANLTRSFDMKVRTASTFYVLFKAWMGGDGGVKDTPLYERWRGMGWDEGSKSAIGKMVKMGKINHPSHHHTLDPSPHNLLSAGFSLRSHFWNLLRGKRCLRKVLGCREIAQLVPHSFPPSYKYKYTSMQTQKREIQQLICVIHRPLTNTLTLELNFWKSFGKKMHQGHFCSTGIIIR